MVIGRLRSAVAEMVGDDDGPGPVFPTDDAVVARVSSDASLGETRIREITGAVQDVIDSMYPQLAEEAVAADDERGAAQEEGFLYGFRASQDVLVVGGAAGVLSGVGDRLGLSTIEVEAVRDAHRIAANMNGYAEHVVMDDVVLARDRHVDRNVDVSDGQAALADAVEGVSDDGYPLATPGTLAGLDLDEEKYFGVTPAFPDDGVELRFDPADRDAPYHAVVAADGTVRISDDLGRALALDRRDVSWDSVEGAIVARCGPLVDTVPGGRHTKLVKRDGWEGHVPNDALRRADLETGDDAAMAIDAVGGERLVVVDPDVRGDVAVGAVATSGVGTQRTVVELPEAVEDVLELERGNVNVAWDVEDGVLVGNLLE